jgi:competence protein ComEC
LIPGDWIRVRAVLAPPPPPALPGAFDFQRHAYFQKLGATGFAVGPAEVIARADHDEGSFLLGLERLRQSITERVRETIGGDAGAVAAALITGDRAAISKELNDAMRDSGLAHLLSISGLHISLVAGILFVTVRGILALVPPLALRFPIKKWAAVAALPGAVAYGLLAGATAPTQRSVLMFALVIVAILVDRRAISMRAVAWAAFAILLVQPESLTGASFQMSFAAVVALIAGWEILSERRQADQPGWWRRGVFKYLGGVALTSLLAGAATAPFALYHFNRFAAYGLIANMIAVPLTAVWVMPCAVAAALLMPFGLEAVALVPMGWGVTAVNEVARAVAAWPGATALLPTMPSWGLAFITFGGLWLCLWRRRWRLFGAGAIAAGLASVLFARPPDILVDGGGLFAVRGEDGRLAFSSTRSGRFLREVWLRQAGFEPDEAEAWPSEEPSADGRLACDALGCIYRASGQTVALVHDRAALVEDCWAAPVVVSAVPLGSRPCAGRARIIDGRDLKRDGAHALWLTSGGIRIASVNDTRGHRPWVARPRERGGR